jgi:chromosome segregation ATPase
MLHYRGRTLRRKHPPPAAACHQAEKGSLDSGRAGLKLEQAALEERRAALQRALQQAEAREAGVAAAEASLEALRQQLEQQQAELVQQARKVGAGSGVLPSTVEVFGQGAV